MKRLIHCAVCRRFPSLASPSFSDPCVCSSRLHFLVGGVQRTRRRPSGISAEEGVIWTETSGMGETHSMPQSMEDISALPEDVLLEVLALVPATDLLSRCRLVCKLWRDVIDSPTLWKIKCHHDGYVAGRCQRQPKDWKVFYYLASSKKNLLKNPSALKKFKHWEIENNGGDRWKVETLPGDMGEGLPDPAVKKYFVTSYGLCTKSQLIEVKTLGYSDQLMDEHQPNIVIKDWYAARRDCGCRYELLVSLLSENKETLVSFSPEPVCIEQWSDATWHLMTHTFSQYGPGVRYIYFNHGGMDRQFWAGWYGVRVTNSSVTIEPEDLSAEPPRGSS